MNDPWLLSRRWLVALLACGLTATTGCYQPVIGDGSLRCAADNTCPHGFSCGQADHLCWRMPDARDGSASGQGGRGGGSGVDAPAQDASTDRRQTDAGPCGAVAAPANFGQSCGSCGGRVRCDGSCDIPTPTNFAAACGHCGGVVQCNEACTIADPPGLGSACGSCGGVIQCSGQCSVATPSDLGTVSAAATPDSFSCCFIDETRQYGPSGRNTSGCFPGYAYAGCTVGKQSGLGVVSVTNEDPQTCTCQVHVNNTGTDGASYVVTIRQIRGC